MTNQQLSDYIHQQLQQGKTAETIKAELLNVGWPETAINQVLGSLDTGSAIPRPPQQPTFTSKGKQRLHPRAVWLFFLSSVTGFFLFFAFFSFLIGVNFAEVLTDSLTGIMVIVVVIFLILLSVSFIWAKLSYHYYRYELAEEGFRKELGVIFKKYVTIPYDRIQNVDIHRTLIARFLGLSNLNVQTAGVSGVAGAEGHLPGVSREVAEELRDEIIKRARQSKNQGL